MATTQLSSSFPLSSDALFRAWGVQISNALAALGWVQTADTGQINWTTVVRPGTSNTAAGYEIWRMNDSLQSTYPVFLKLEYATGGGVAAASLFFTIGSATDGTGNLVGATSTRTQATQTAASPSGAALEYLSAASNRLAFFHYGNASNANFGVVIERTKDATGADTGEGVLIINFHSGVGRQQVWFPTGAGTQEGTLGAMPPGVGTGSNGAQVAIYPIFLTKGTFMYPGLNVFAYHNSNISALTPVTVTVYGADHVYLPIPSTYLSTAIWRLNGSNIGILMRWE